MNPSSGYVPYQVVVSLHVQQQLQRLSAQARNRGDQQAFLNAYREFIRRLAIYPQFGDPLSDLIQETGQVRIGVVAPLVMRYGVLEDRRIVFVTLPAALLPLPRQTGPGD